MSSSRGQVSTILSLLRTVGFTTIQQFMEEELMLDNETRNSVFENNHAPDRGGGALQLAFCGVETVTHNSISIVSTRFRENAAAWGAAAAFFSSLSPSEQYNSLTFTDCWFEGNAASIGAAIAKGLSTYL